MTTTQARSGMWGRWGRSVVAMAAFAGVGATAAPARAGVTIVFQHGTSPPATMSLDGNKIRVESPEREARTTSVIIDAAAKKMTVLDDRAKTYTEINEDDVKRVRGQVTAMRGQLQQQMATMPPEQRQRMQEMLDKMAAPGAASDKPVKHTFKFESLGQKKTINGMSCQMYKVLRDGKAHEEDCISPWSAGLLKKDDVEGLRKFGEEMVSSMGMTDGHARQAFDGIDQYPGVPISRVVLNDDGTRGDEDQVKSITRGSIPAVRFTVPAGYTKKDLSSMGPGKHGPPSP